MLMIVCIYYKMLWQGRLVTDRSNFVHFNSKDHPGLTNGFLRKSSDSLVALYGDESTLEYHHFTTLCNILRNRKNDIFVNILQQ